MQFRFCYHLQAGEGADIAERTSDTFTMIMEKVRKSAEEAVVPAALAVAAEADLQEALLPQSKDRPSVVDEQAQWVQNGTDWKLDFKLPVRLSRPLGTERWSTGTGLRQMVSWHTASGYLTWATGTT